MALRKRTTLDNGVVADYWKVIACDVRANKVHVGLFVDRVHATDLNNILMRISVPVEFDLDVLNQRDMNPLKIAYVEAKRSRIEDDEETNYLVDAEDVLEADVTPVER